MVNRLYTLLEHNPSKDKEHIIVFTVGWIHHSSSQRTQPFLPPLRGFFISKEHKRDTELNNADFEAHCMCRASEPLPKLPLKFLINWYFDLNIVCKRSCSFLCSERLSLCNSLGNSQKSLDEQRFLSSTVWLFKSFSGAKMRQINFQRFWKIRLKISKGKWLNGQPELFFFVLRLGIAAFF